MKLEIWKKTDKDRICLIKIDACVWGSLSEKVLRTLFHYLPGCFEISEAEASALKDELQRTAWNKLLDWLARQEHSRRESRDYLRKQQYYPDIIDNCVQTAEAKGYIDDARYCRLLIESLLSRQKSPFQIKSKLIEKRLPSSLWEPILKELTSPEDSRQILQTQAEKFYARYCRLDRKTCYEKCLTALYRKGFELDDARDILAKLIKAGE